jgi:hypothetical protein
MKNSLLFLFFLTSIQINAQQTDSLPPKKGPIVGLRPPKDKHGMGLRLLTSLEYSNLPHLKAANFRRQFLLPAKFVVPAPPPGDQGKQGSCVGWSIGYTFFSSYLQRHLTIPGWSDQNEMSPSYVYHFAKITNDCLNSGAYIHTGFETIRDDGSCRLQSWHYSENDCNVMPSPGQNAEACIYSSPWKFGKVPPGPDIDEGGRDLYKANQDGPVLWQAVSATDINLFKTSLVTYNWPIVIGFRVSNSFSNMWYYGAGIWTSNDPSNLGSHSVCIIGYDDNKIANGKKGFLKCQNQWGSQYGDQGYFWISYDLVSQGAFGEVYVWVRDEPAFPGQSLPCPD